MLKRVLIIAVSDLLLTLFSLIALVPAQELQNPDRVPFFELVPAPPVELPAPVDSNSPAFWHLEQGRNRLNVVTSWENPSISQGSSVRRLGTPRPVFFTNRGDGGRWLEAVLKDRNGTLYSYYHNEPLGLCRGTNKTAPRIGAARSIDNGLSWQDMGIVLEVPPTNLDCTTPNEFFAGGIGDFTVVLDQSETDAYFF